MANAMFAGEQKVSVNVAIEGFDQFAFISYLGYMTPGIDISPGDSGYPLDGTPVPVPPPASATPPATPTPTPTPTPPATPTPTPPSSPKAKAPPGGLGAPEGLTPTVEINQLVSDATNVVNNMRTTYEDAQRIVAPTPDGSESKAKADSIKTAYEVAQVALQLFDAIRADLSAAEDVNDNDEVQRLLEKARNNLSDMLVSKDKVDKLYDEIKREVTGDLPLNARDPAVYEKPALPGGLRWPDKPLTARFDPRVSREAWDILLGPLPEVDLTVPGASFDYEMGIVKWFKAWGKATPGFKYAMGFPWPNEGVLQKNDFERRNRVYATGFFGKIKDKVPSQEIKETVEKIVDGKSVFQDEIRFVQNNTINRLAFVQCMQEEGILGSVPVSNISSRPMGMLASVLQHMVKPMQ